MGYNTTASGSSSTAMGFYTTARSYASVAIGRYNVGGGTAGSWVSTDPLFEIGIGTSSSAKANALTVLKNGNVGIGTTSPQNKLDVEGGIAVGPSYSGTQTAPSDGMIVQGKVGIGTSAPDTKLHLTGGTDASLSSGSGYVVIGSVTGKNIVMDDNEIIARDNDTEATLFLQAEGSGKVIIGQKTEVSGVMFAVNGSAPKSAGGTTWAIFSDARLKDIQGRYERGLEEIAELNAVRYRYKQDNALGLPSESEWVGVVAQEVQEVLPECVEERDDGYLMLNSDPILWAMVNAIQTLKAENEQLRERIGRLEAGRAR